MEGVFDMDWSIFNKALEKLAENSPFALVVIATMVVFFMLNKSYAKKANEMYKNAIESIKDSYSIAFDKQQEIIKQLRDGK